MEKLIALLGSTGSIGKQTLDVVRNHPGRFRIGVLTARSNSSLLITQAQEFLPADVIISDADHYREVRDALYPLGIKVHAGEEAVHQVVKDGSIDVTVVALVGFAGLLPALYSLGKGRVTALANKESLVVGGEILMELCKAGKGAIVPVDSEHSAILQCLAGEHHGSVEKIYLTASGGPFRGKNASELAKVTPDEALCHPSWKMGRKITIDSATLMNKGLEVIEARWLFDVEPGQIEVLVHPQSMIHSMVLFHDGSLKAQLSMPDMRIPILYALSYPERLPSTQPRISFGDISPLTFEKPDWKNFRNLALAYEAIKKGGNLPCVLNAANEEAVGAFLGGKIGFCDISRVVEQCMIHAPFISHPGIDDLILTDRESRALARNYWTGQTFV